MIKREFKYRFEVNDRDGTGFYPVGGTLDTMALALCKKTDFEYGRDKRRRKPAMRIVEIVTIENVIEEFK